MERLEDRAMLSATPRVSVSASPSSVMENGSANADFRFTRTGSTAEALVVNFAVSGSAKVGADYTASESALFAEGLLVFDVGQATKTIAVHPVNDQLVESNETVVLTVADGNGYLVGTSNSATATIVSDDSVVSVAVSAASVLEDGTKNLVYTFTRTGGPGALTVNFDVSGSASAKTDYTQTGADQFRGFFSRISFGAGQTKKTVTINPVADTLKEGDETVTLTLRNSSGYTVGDPSSATGTITDDDPRVTLAVTSEKLIEDKSGHATYAFRRTGDVADPLTVNFTVAGTATFDEDYQVTGTDDFSSDTGTGTITFAPGQATAKLLVDPNRDTKSEADETVILTLAGGSDYFVGTLTPAKATIVNDDAEISIAVSTESVSEDGTANLVYTFTRTGVKSNALTVKFDLGEETTATFQNDYTPSGAATFTKTGGTVAFLAGQTTKKITIDPVADQLAEADELVTLTLHDSTGYSIKATANSATGIIANDDPRVLIAVSSSSVIEHAGTTTTFRFIRTGPTTNELTVNFAISGTATFLDDYETPGTETISSGIGTVTFQAGSATARVVIAPVADSDVESNETVILTVIAGIDYAVGAPLSVTVSIIDDDLLNAIP